VKFEKFFIFRPASCRNPIYLIGGRVDLRRNLLARLFGADNLSPMKVNELDYTLPDRLIARHGLPNRTDSRLMVLDRGRDTLLHTRFNTIADFFNPGDCLVLNDTRVIPARFAVRRATGGVIEGLFLTFTESGDWQVMLKRASRLKIGEKINLTRQNQPEETAARPMLTVVKKLEEGQWLLKPDFIESWLSVLDIWGCTPLPPYIHRPAHDQEDPVDRQRYQTVYADRPGSVAAPTAGLHFSQPLLDALAARGITVARLTLHVGIGTFKPVTAERLEDHIMHFESYQLDPGSAETINRTIERRGRIVAVGTTTVRTLETLADGPRVRSGAGRTNLFITPGYAFKIVNAMVTNFHLPRSTLLALVCAFAGTERILNAYRVAVEQEYRFYSYGDAMLIL
jgi:S-adenosylmethionine:tRNA ribosyltransferase-isomerase